MFVTTLRPRIARWTSVAAIVGSVLVLGAAKPWAHVRAAYFGGPWISVETPVNPFDSSTRGALLLVHTFHHGTPEDMAMTGKAEGLVDGQRRTVTVSVDKSSRTGTYSVHRQWGDKGIWTVLVSATPTEHTTTIQAVVEVGADGEIGRVSVPRTAQGIPRLLSVAEVEQGLRGRAKAPVAVGAR